jgi:hypothetical protein
MASKTSGYRSQRLRQRQSRRAQSWQSITLYVLAATVAFAAVFGAVVLADRFVSHSAAPRPDSYLALVTVGANEPDRRPIAGLLVVDRSTAETTFFVIPPTLLFTGSEGEYVYAEDALRSPDFRSYVERLTEVPIDRVVSLTYEQFIGLAGGSDLYVRFPRSVSLEVDGAQTTFEGARSIAAGSIGDVLGAAGGSGPDQALAEQVVIEALLTTAALRPEAERDAGLDPLVANGDDAARRDQREALEALVGGRVVVERLPSQGLTARGQFAYRPDSELIRARITRKSPTYDPPFTVAVQNGSGEAGIGQIVADRLAVLDVDLSPVTNASSFDFRETQILAGERALGTAEDVRAILGRGVVLKGRDLPADTVVVIIGKDLKAKDLQ